MSKEPKFFAEQMDVGVDDKKSDFSPRFEWDKASYNISGGRYSGTGPRFGFSPIPGHSDTETPSGDDLEGLMGTEAANPGSGRALSRRRKILGIVPLQLDYTPDHSKGTHYIYLVAIDRTGSGDIAFQFVYGGQHDGTEYVPRPHLYAGLVQDLVSNYPSSPSGDYSSITDFIVPETTKSAGMQDLAEVTDEKAYARFAAIFVPGKEIPMREYVARTLADPSASKIPNLNMNRLQDFSYSNDTMGLGAPSEYNLQNFKKTERSVKFLPINDDGIVFAQLSAVFKAKDQFNRIQYDSDHTSVHFAEITSGVTEDSAPGGGAGFTYADTEAMLVKDGDSVVNSGYKAILAAYGGKAYCAVIQEWIAHEDGPRFQYVDLINEPLKPRTKETSNYEVDGIAETSCFREWEDLPSTGNTTGSRAVEVSQGGVLAPDTVYEVTYAVYNKRLDWESNVGKPALVRTGAAGTSSVWQIEIDDNTTTNGAMYTDFKANSEGVLDYPGQYDANIGDHVSINYLEYRFYYRIRGQKDWIPGLFIDAAKYWFGTFDDGSLIIGEAAIGATVGGDVGGFNDYSPLPDEYWLDVVIFKNRAFWISEKTFCFSNQNNVFQYPIRNRYTARTGKWRGLMVVNYPGQADQDARLLVFGDTVYVGKFTGVRLDSSVTLGTGTYNFPLDGSDFVLNAWTDNTCFTGRSAILADGVPYWWGPDGVFMDSGTDTPVRVSKPIEPLVHKLYDPRSTDEIHAAYWHQTKEIVWFYVPRDSSDETHAIVFCTETGEWNFWRFGAKIDAVQQLDIDDANTAKKIGGKRLVAYVREASSDDVQRAYFFDERNRAGDIYPTTEMMVKSVSEPSSGRRRLTLASGYDATLFSNIAVGDEFHIHQAAEYVDGNMTNAEDFLAKVVAKGSGTLDFTLPTGVSFDASATLGRESFFPIYRTSTHGFAWRAESTFWIPGGIDFNAVWHHLHMLFRLNKVPSDYAQTLCTVGFQLPTIETATSRDLTILDAMLKNGHMQAFFQTQTPNEGQGFKLVLSGTYNASDWVLQYFAGHFRPVDTEILKQFQR